MSDLKSKDKGLWQVDALFNGSFSLAFKDREGKDLVSPMKGISSNAFLLRSENSCILIDTGFDPSDLKASSSQAGQKEEEKLDGLLKEYGLKASDIKDVILTHLHWDHTAGMALFPEARFHVQADSFRAFNTLNPNEETYYRPKHWLSLLDRVNLIEGDSGLFPGIELVLTGKHCPGHQVVFIDTKKGKLLIAGDLPYDYSSLWSDLPSDFWAYYKENEGRELWWSREDKDKVHAFMDKNKLLDPPLLKSGPSFSSLKKTSDNFVFSHDRDISF